MNTIQKQIQALLFWKNEPMTANAIAKVLSLDLEVVKEELTKLEALLADQGIVLVQDGEEMMLATSSEVSSFITELEKTERSKELSKAALETLSIILYKGPISRSEIDYIRGVNSQFIVRHLEIRGLIEKEQSHKDARVFLYKTTLDLLAFLGITKREELPEFGVLTKQVEQQLETNSDNPSEEEKTDNLE